VAGDSGREDLIAVIRDIRGKLGTGVFRNEADISNSVVIRLLQQLQWDVFDPARVSPQFSIGRRKADYALRQEPFGPVVLIEVKAPGKPVGQGEEQLFEYCFGQGVPLAVLTNGRHWSFYYPAGAGSYDQRCFARADLERDTAEEVARRQTRYVGFAEVTSGRWPRTVQDDYEAWKRQLLAAQEFPDVFRSLLKTPAPKFVELFRDEVAARSGTRPPSTCVTEYLRATLNGVEPSVPICDLYPPVPPATPPFFVLNGRTVACASDAALLVAALRELQDRDSSLLGKLAPRLKTGKRRWLHQDPGGIYSADSPARVRGYVREIRSGWWLGLFNTSRRKNQQLLLAREEAGLAPGDFHWKLKGKIK